MPRKNPPTNTDADITLATLVPAFADEDKARELFESKRWPNGPVCPHCKATNVCKLTPKPGSKSPVRPGVYKCRDCRKQFTARVGTIFEDSKIPMHKWLMAIHLMSAAKNGISSHEMARLLDVTQKSGWFICHRLRAAMAVKPQKSMLGGVVEVDETWVGARKPRHPAPDRSGPKNLNKYPVVALVERGGNAVAFPVHAVNSLTLKGAINTVVDKDSAIVTDEHRCYVGIGEYFDGGHHTVHHKAKEYVRCDDKGPIFVSTNTVEGFFARLKRSFVGTHHKMSARHLHRYVAETMFRWNTRKNADGIRMVAIIRGAEGKRLMYETSTEK